MPLKKIRLCEAVPQNPLEREMLSEATLEDVLESWSIVSGSDIKVEALQPSDLNAASKCITEAFYVPGPLKGTFVDRFFAFQFRVGVLDGMQVSLRYRSKHNFAILLVWDDAHENVVASVQVSIAEEKQILKSLPEGTKSFALISSMAVISSMRRRGIGQALLSAAEFVALKWDEKEIVLNVHKDNEPAVAFYKSCGYVEIPREFFKKGILSGPEILLMRREW